MPENQIKISARPTSDPDVCNFLVEGKSFSSHPVGCKSAKMAEGSPLFEALFNIKGVREVLVLGNVVIVAKSIGDSWPTFGKLVGQAIRNAVNSDKPPIPSDWNDKAPSDAEIFGEVEQILASRVNPGVAAHGGKIELVEVKGGAVYLRLSGGCQGCGAANVTLKQGIEKAIRARLPQVTEIIDITDHSFGKNPFYKTKRDGGSPFES
jgi:Fe-S cluster biogenesis protein NfuA